MVAIIERSSVPAATAIRVVDGLAELVAQHLRERKYHLVYPVIELLKLAIYVAHDLNGGAPFVHVTEDEL